MCRHRRNNYYSGPIVVAPVVASTDGPMQFQGRQNGYVLVDSPFGYDNGCTCGRRRCRCYRRHRRQRGPGPVGLLISGIMSLVNSHQQRKQQQQQQRPIAEQEPVRKLKKEMPVGTTTAARVREEDLGDSRSEYGDYDEETTRDWEQHQRDLERQRQRDEEQKHWESGPPPYKA